MGRAERPWCSDANVLVTSSDSIRVPSRQRLGRRRPAMPCEWGKRRRATESPCATGFAAEINFSGLGNFFEFSD
jgi:hypothetical protein